MHAILEMLTGGDRRSIGRAGEVAARVLAEPELFGVLIDGMLADDPIVRMRAADAAEKVTVERPDLLRPFKAVLLRRVSLSQQQEVRWHLAQMITRLPLDRAERRRVVALLNSYLRDQSGIVRVFSMQALADLALQDAGLRPGITRRLRSLTRTGTPAMRSRGRKLLARLKGARPGR